MATKRMNGEGTISQIHRSNGRTVWRAGETVRFADGAIKKRVWGEGPTVEAAKEALRRNITRQQVKIGELPPTALRALSSQATAITVEDFFKNWIERKDVKETTRAQYETQLRLYLYPYFGTVPMISISQEEMERHFQITLKEQTKDDGTPLFGPSAYRHTFRTIKSGFEAAVRQGIIPSNPMARLTSPKRKKTTPQEQRTRSAQTHWVPQQIVKYCAGTEDDARWILALFGVRQGEALGLTWDKIKWGRYKNQGKIYIEQQLKRHHMKHGCGTGPKGNWKCGRQADNCPKKTGKTGFYLAEELKTEKSERELPLVEPLYSALKNWKKIQDQYKETDEWQPLPGLENLVFTTKRGTPRRPQDDRLAWKQLLKDAGIPTDLRVHDARHFAASMMIAMDGISLEQVMKTGGWSNPKVLLDTYTHLGASFTREGLEIFGQQLGQRR